MKHFKQPQADDDEGQNIGLDSPSHTGFQSTWTQILQLIFLHAVFFRTKDILFTHTDSSMYTHIKTEYQTVQFHSGRGKTKSHRRHLDFTGKRIMASTKVTLN